MKLSKLAERVNYELVQGNEDVEVSFFTYDSREVVEGSCFLCITGTVTDGHNYAGKAIEAGAVALVVEREIEVPGNITVIKVEDARYALAMMSCAYFGYPEEQLKVIGITGTKGKTTTTYMIRNMLEDIGYKVGLIGTIETIIGDKRIPASHTTPASYTIQ